MEWQPHEHALCLFESDAWHITSLPGASQHQVALLLPDAAHRPACTCDRQLRFHARTSVRACVRRPEGAYCAAGLAAAAAAASRSAGHLPASRGVPGRRPCSAATPAQPCSRRRCGSIPDGRRHRSTRRPAARPCCSRKPGGSVRAAPPAVNSAAAARGTDRQLRDFMAESQTVYVQMPTATKKRSGAN